MQKRQPESISPILALRTLQPGHYESEVPAAWTQGRACFGGLLLAFIARACRHGVPTERTLRSINIAYVAPVQAGRIAIEAVALRSGSAVTHMQATLRQGPNIAVAATLSYGLPRPGSLEIPPLPLPTRSPPGRGKEMPFMPPMTPEFTQHIDYRWETDKMPFAGNAHPHVAGWVRPSIPIPMDEAMILMMLDAYPPPLWSQAKQFFVASSLSSHFQIRAVPDDPNPHPWFYYDGPASVVGDGYSDVQARLWHENGTLVAVGVQMFADFSAKKA